MKLGMKPSRYQEVKLKGEWESNLVSSSCAFSFCVSSLLWEPEVPSRSRFETGTGTPEKLNRHRCREVLSGQVTELPGPSWANCFRSLTDWMKFRDCSECGTPLEKLPHALLVAEPLFWNSGQNSITFDVITYSSIVPISATYSFSSKIRSRLRPRVPNTLWFFVRNNLRKKASTANRLWWKLSWITSKKQIERTWLSSVLSSPLLPSHLTP